MISVASTDQADRVEPEIYGWKAHWLWWLKAHGFAVPRAIFIKARHPSERMSDREASVVLEEVQRRFRASGRPKRVHLAVRSSATNEDTQGLSLAGHFSTIIGKVDETQVPKMVNSVRASGMGPTPVRAEKMGVVIQKAIVAEFAGVAFSTSPISKSKRETVVSVARGGGAALVGGQTAGYDIRVTGAGQRMQILGESPMPRNVVIRVARAAKRIERLAGIPVDIEWCLEEQTGRLYFLQCRPATGIIGRPPSVVEVSRRNRGHLDVESLNHPKVAQRLACEDMAIRASKAYIVTCDLRGGTPTVPDLSVIHPSNDCQAYSVVLIQPRTAQGKVQRAFLSCSIKATDFLRNCQRYAIRSYPRYSNLRESIEEMASLCAKDAWSATFIVQEVYDARFSGMARRIDDGYLVELGQGHFLPKGVVTASRYVVDPTGHVVLRYEPDQLQRWRIIDGYIIEEDLAPANRKANLPPTLPKRIAESFRTLLDAKRVVEFGVVDREDGPAPYLIDFVEEGDGVGMDSEAIASGILSRGKVTGRIEILGKLQGKDSLEAHFHDAKPEASRRGERRIFVCDLPDISLLPLVYQNDPSEIGFIFREGSILCHMAVVLRERGIPAVVLSGPQKLIEGAIVTLDTERRSANKEMVITNG